MEKTKEVTTLEILTFWVGPFLLGVEAGQIASLPGPFNRELPIHNGEGIDELPIFDLRPACGLPVATNTQQCQALLVNRAGEMVAYLVDQVADLITVEIGGQIWPLPPLLDVQKRWQQLWGVCQWNGQLVLLVDLQYESLNTPKEG
jgi:hypothetical protein